MFPGPVFYYELRAAARLRRTYVIRMLVGAIFLYLLLATNNFSCEPQRYSEWSGSQDNPGEGMRFSELSRLGESLYQIVKWVSYLAILTLTPAMVSSAIAEDRQRRILFYLLASPLGSIEIILGKLTARLINLGMMVAVGVPVIFIAFLLGGVDPTDAILSFSTLFSILFAIAALSICCSTFSEKPFRALFRSYFFVGLWLILPVFPLSQIQWHRILPLWSLEYLDRVFDWFWWLPASSPILRVEYNWRPMTQSDVELDLWGIGIRFLLGVILLAFSAWRLRPIEASGYLTGGRPRRGRTILANSGIFSRRPCTDSPMIWKECGPLLGSASLSKLIRVGLLGLLFAGYLIGFFVIMVLPCWELSGIGYSVDYLSSRLNGATRMYTILFYLLGGVMLAAMSAASVTSEREKDTWISLVATPLDVREIVNGKILGSLWSIRYFVLLMLATWVLSVSGGGLHPVVLLGLTFCVAVYYAFIAVLGTLISIMSKTTTRAVATVIIILMFLNGGYLMCCLPGVSSHGPVAVIFAGVTPAVIGFVADQWTGYSPHFHGTDAAVEIYAMLTASFLFYGVATLVLYERALSLFSVLVDRPKRNPLLHPMAGPDEIRFIEEVKGSQTTKASTIRTPTGPPVEEPSDDA